ncbi:hypothetical protein PPERSA_01246 [Pseudocohnilembus persalinus]|uniref:Transmembrane protein n=1 Tax=Pseudocohnilembus persalinus TaxID=266149 RepID=A0A0V0QGL8_PSEPJ|nr:hypothetical protein PPERSA_01246 [Pseudocohnilembus persalinus]|eukprot:KRX01343.1 hypothetical protein PPERSA_01246 [Pseudocohnilembus persalinus]
MSIKMPKQKITLEHVQNVLQASKNENNFQSAFFEEFSQNILEKQFSSEQDLQLSRRGSQIVQNLPYQQLSRQQSTVSSSSDTNKSQYRPKSNSIYAQNHTKLLKQYTILDENFDQQVEKSLNSIHHFYQEQNKSHPEILAEEFKRLDDIPGKFQVNTLISELQKHEITITGKLNSNLLKHSQSMTQGYEMIENVYNTTYDNHNRIKLARIILKSSKKHAIKQFRSLQKKNLSIQNIQKTIQTLKKIKNNYVQKVVDIKISEQTQRNTHDLSEPLSNFRYNYESQDYNFNTNILLPKIPLENYIEFMKKLVNNFTKSIENYHKIQSWHFKQDKKINVPHIQYLTLKKDEKILQDIKQNENGNNIIVDDDFSILKNPQFQKFCTEVKLKYLETKDFFSDLIQMELAQIINSSPQFLSLNPEDFQKCLECVFEKCKLNMKKFFEQWENHIFNILQKETWKNSEEFKQLNQEDLAKNLLAIKPDLYHKSDQFFLPFQPKKNSLRIKSEDYQKSIKNLLQKTKLSSLSTYKYKNPYEIDNFYEKQMEKQLKTHTNQENLDQNKENILLYMKLSDKIDQQLSNELQIQDIQITKQEFTYPHEGMICLSGNKILRAFDGFTKQLGKFALLTYQIATHCLDIFELILYDVYQNFLSENLKKKLVQKELFLDFQIDNSDQITGFINEFENQIDSYIKSRTYNKLRTFSVNTEQKIKKISERTNIKVQKKALLDASERITAFSCLDINLYYLKQIRDLMKQLVDEYFYQDFLENFTVFSQIVNLKWELQSQEDNKQDNNYIKGLVDLLKNQKINQNGREILEKDFYEIMTQLNPYIVDETQEIKDQQNLFKNYINYFQSTNIEEIFYYIENNMTQFTFRNIVTMITNSQAFSKMNEDDKLNTFYRIMDSDFQEESEENENNDKNIAMKQNQVRKKKLKNTIMLDKKDKNINVLKQTNFDQYKNYSENNTPLALELSQQQFFPNYSKNYKQQLDENLINLEATQDNNTKLQDKLIENQEVNNYNEEDDENQHSESSHTDNEPVFNDQNINIQKKTNNEQQNNVSNLDSVYQKYNSILGYEDNFSEHGKKKTLNLPFPKQQTHFFNQFSNQQIQMVNTPQSKVKGDNDDEEEMYSEEDEDADETQSNKKKEQYFTSILKIKNTQNDKNSAKLKQDQKTSYKQKQHSKSDLNSQMLDQYTKQNPNQTLQQLKSEETINNLLTLQNKETKEESSIKQKFSGNAAFSNNTLNTSQSQEYFQADQEQENMCLLYCSQKSNYFVYFRWKYFFEFFFYHFLFYCFMGPFINLIFYKKMKLMRNLMFYGGHPFQTLNYIINIFSLTAYYAGNLQNIYPYAIAVKYATFDKYKIYRFKNSVWSKEQLMKEMIVGKWILQIKELQFQELHASVRKLEVDESMFYISFIVDPNQKQLESFNQKCIELSKYYKSKKPFQPTPIGEQLIKGENEFIYGYGILTELIDIYNQKANFTRKKAFRYGLLYAFGKVSLPYFVRWSEGKPPFGANALETCCMITLGITTILTNYPIFILIYTGIQDIQRKIFLMQQLALSLSPRKLQNLDEKKWLPTINIFSSSNIKGWMMIRKLLQFAWGMIFLASVF